MLANTLKRLNLSCLTADQDDPLQGTWGHWCVDYICVGGRLVPHSPKKSEAWPINRRLEDFKATLTDHYGVLADLDLVEAPYRPPMPEE
jgi:hypothetical protein